MVGTGGHSTKKRQHSSSPMSTLALFSRGTPIDHSYNHKRRPYVVNTPSLAPPSPHYHGFNDGSTADVSLRLRLEPSPFDFDPGEYTPESERGDVQIYLHSEVLRRSKYFAALLSDRWQRRDENPPEASDKIQRLNFFVAASNRSINAHLKVLQLLYTDDLSSAIDCVSSAIEILPVALELLFEDCVKACVQFLEAVPWSEEEEKRILSVIPLLGEEESLELLGRVSPVSNGMSEEMLHGLILSAIHNHQNMAFVKAFVAKLLRDFSSKDSSRRVLDRAFETSLKVVKESLEEYSSPAFRGDHNETEAIQRLNLHTALTNGRHVLWLVERMIELKVADTAVKAWSEQPAFTADLQKAFRDDACKNIVPGLPAVLLRCTSRLANAIVSGSILAPRQVRMKFVKDWLPVLNVSKENAVSMLHSHKSLYPELEDTFLQIISTLPLTDAEELLQQCLSFSTRNVEDCPHLVTAFNTWFRRATLPFSSSS